MSPLQSVKALTESYTHIRGMIGVFSYSQSNLILHSLVVCNEQEKKSAEQVSTTEKKMK